MPTAARSAVRAPCQCAKHGPGRAIPAPAPVPAVQAITVRRPKLRRAGERQRRRLLRRRLQDIEIGPGRPRQRWQPVQNRR